MDCFCGTLKGIWDFFLGSIRFILFTVCLIFVIFQLVWLGLLISTKNSAGLGLPESDLDYKVFLHSVVLICAGLFGCWASFFKNDQALKLFAILTTICAVVLFIMVLTSMSPEAKKKIKPDYIESLKENAKYYDWKRDGKADARSRNATEIWDSLQSLFCCGLNGANDWDDNRPSDIDKKYFPPSCCFPGTVDKDSKLCSSKDGLIKGGCLKRVEELEVGHILIYVVFIAALVILTFLTCIYVFGSD